LFATGAEAVTFDYEFDNTPDTTVILPIVGTGTFSVQGDPGNGTFPLTTLTNPEFFFEFPSLGETFITSELLTPASNVSVIIRTVGRVRLANFESARSPLAPTAAPLPGRSPSCRFQADSLSLPPVARAPDSG